MRRFSNWQRDFFRRMRAWKRKSARSVNALEPFHWQALVDTLRKFFIYAILSVIIGVCVGVVTAIFGRGLLLINE